MMWSASPLHFQGSGALPPSPPSPPSPPRVQYMFQVRDMVAQSYQRELRLALTNHQSSWELCEQAITPKMGERPM